MLAFDGFTQQTVMNGGDEVGRQPFVSFELHQYAGGVPSSAF